MIFFKFILIFEFNSNSFELVKNLVESVKLVPNIFYSFELTQVNFDSHSNRGF